MPSLLPVARRPSLPEAPEADLRAEVPVAVRPVGEKQEALPGVAEAVEEEAAASPGVAEEALAAGQRGEAVRLRLTG